MATGNANEFGTTPYGTSLQPGSSTPFGPIAGAGEFGLPMGLGAAWHTALLSEISAMMGADGYVRRRNPTTGVWEKTTERTEGALARIADEAYRNAQVGFQEATLTGTYNGQPTQAARQIQQQADQWNEQMGWTKEEGKKRLGIQLAALQTEATGRVHTIDDAGNVTRTDTLTTSEEGRQAQLALQQAAVTGVYTSPGTKVPFNAQTIIGDAADLFPLRWRPTPEALKAALATQVANARAEAARTDRPALARAQLQAELTQLEGTQQRLQAWEASSQGTPQLTVQGRAAKLNEAAQKTQDTGIVHVVTESGQVVQATGTNGQPLQTTSEQGRQAQLELQQATLTGTYDGAPTLAALAQQSQARQALVAEALSQSQQTGQVYRVKVDGTGIELARDAQGQPVQTTSEQGRLFTQQLQTAAATGVLAGQATVAGRAALADQALQQSQTTGYAYQVNAAGTGIEPVLRNGQQVRTESAEGRLATQALEQQKLGQQATQFAATQAQQQTQFTATQAQQATQFSRTAAQQEATRLTEATGQVYSVAGAGTANDPFRAVPAGSAGAAGAAGTSPAFVAPAGTQTLAARAQLFQQAIQRGTETGFVHTVNDQGQVVPQTNAQGNQIRTDSSQGRLYEQALARAQTTGTFTDPVTGQTTSTLAAQQQTWQQGFQTRQQALTTAQQRGVETGLVHTVDAAGNVVQLQVNGQPVQTTSEQGRLFQQQLATQQQELQRQGQTFQQGIAAAGVTGTYEGQQTLAARQQALAAAAQQTEATGFVYILNAQGQPVQAMDAQGQPVRTDSSQGRLFQEQLARDTLALQREVQTFQQGIQTAGVTGTYQGQLTLAAKQQSRDAALTRAANLTQQTGNVHDLVEQPDGTFTVQQVVNSQTGLPLQSTSEQGRLFQQGRQAQEGAWAQANQLTQASGFIYEVVQDAQGNLVPRKTEVQTESAQGRQFAQQLEQQRLDETKRQFDALQTGYLEATGQTAENLTTQRDQTAQALQRATTAGGTDPQTGRTVAQLQQLVGGYDSALNELRTSGTYTDPHSGQRVVTLQRSMQELNAAILRAEQTGTLVDPVTGQARETLRAQKQNADIAAQAAGLTGEYVDPTTGQRRTTLAAQQQGFTQQQAIAQLAANPRNYIEAAMLGRSRGGLDGFAAANQLNATTPAFVAPAAAAGTGAGQGPAAQSQQAGSAGAFQAPQAQPQAQSAAQRLQYAGAATTGADIPVTAATRALLENRAVPGFGAISGPSGGYANQQQLTAAFRPNQIRFQDYARLAPSEQQQTKAVASLAGYDPADFEEQMRRASTPRFRAPSVGRLM